MFQINYCASKIVRVISPPPLGAHCIVTSQVFFVKLARIYDLVRFGAVALDLRILFLRMLGDIESQ